MDSDYHLVVISTGAEFISGPSMQCCSLMTTQADFKWICALIAELHASPSSPQTASGRDTTHMSALACDAQGEAGEAIFSRGEWWM